MQDMIRSLRYLFTLVFIGLAGTAIAQSGGAITGTVLDNKKEPLIGAIIRVFEGGLQKGGAQTDVDGNYDIKPLAAGRYDLVVSYTGYKESKITGVIVSPDKTTQVNVSMELSKNNTLTEVVVTGYKVPLIDKYAPGTTTTITSEQLEKMPTRSTNQVAATTAGVYADNSGLKIQGARTDGTQYIIDGVRVVNGRGINLSQSMIDQVQVMTSGLSAKYGDAIGGVVTITTKGVSEKTRGSVLLEHSVDGYNHNLVNASVSGPLFKKKIDSLGNKKAVVGYLLGGDLWYDKDNNPSYGGNYTVKEDVLKQLQDKPLVATPTQNGGVIFKNAAEYLRADDYTIQKQRANAASTEVRLNGKLDFQLTDNLNLVAGAQLNYTKSRAYSRTGYSLFSPEATPVDNNYTGRGYIRLTQRFGKASVGTSDEKKSVVSNAYYSVQVDYNKEYQKRQHPDHKTDLFKYGYVGKFNTDYTSLYSYGVDDSTKKTGMRLITDRFATGTTYERSDMNPLLANYTSQYYDMLGYTPRTLDDIRSQGGLINGQLPTAVYGLYNNVGYSLTGYNYSSLDQFAVTVDASFDLQPGKTKHAIEFGLYYQQQVSRFFGTLGANSLGQNIWLYMRQLANSHIGLGGEPIFIVNGQRYTRAQVDSGLASPGPLDTIIYDRVANEKAQSTFDRNLRQKLGAGKTDYINVDAYDPSTYSLSMFSADELLNSGNPFVGYQGYDYTGKKQKGQVNFNDFFTKKDANGNYTREIGAYRPNYIAGYILDKFKFKDILFNIGLRVDRFDANTKTLKDPYSLYEVQNVSSANSKGLKNTLNGGVTPTNIKNDYVVYVNSNESSTPTIIGYRNGDDWYDYTGKQIEDPTILKNYSNGRDPQPLLVDSKVRITDTNFNPNTSFTDYKPQVNVMPRISFSFPISDVALFYAHYDVIVQRPSSNVYATPADYYYLSSNQNSIINNPGLKPQKLFDYEVGFQQQLSKRSALTLTAFYKERKDMIQIRPYLYAWPSTYYTFGNRDFSTAKGMTLAYDLRRAGNIRMNIAYTLQFAQGTGSSTTSGNGGSSVQISPNGLLQNFISAQLPNLRYATALDYDSRHQITASIDYRYDDADGPVVGGKHILENSGINLLFNTRSGEPYTKYAYPKQNVVQGEVNGSRYPWHFRLDLRVDKDFNLNFGKKPAEGAKPKMPLILNAFVYIQNVLNTREILKVDGYTSRPDDDGYLASPQGTVYTKNQTDPISYTDLYSIWLRNPGNVNLPRRINIGLSLNF